MGWEEFRVEVILRILVGIVVVTGAAETEICLELSRRRLSKTSLQAVGYGWGWWVRQSLDVVRKSGQGA